MTIRIEKNKKADSPVSLHLQQGSLEGNSADPSLEIKERANNQTVNTSGKTYQEKETGLEHAR